MYKIILASKSEVRKDILEKNNIECNVVHSNVDEDPVKDSLIAKGANPETISKNLAELKANKVSQINENRLVLGADSVIDLNGKLISKPSDRKDALRILKLLNGFDINMTDNEGNTLLHHACERQHNEIVKLLLDNGANPNIREKSFQLTPLHWATEYGDKNMIELLIY